MNRVNSIHFSGPIEDPVKINLLWRNKRKYNKMIASVIEKS